MIDFSSLVKKTSAYKIVEGEKKAGRLSHAYLIITADQTFHDEYLKVFAQLIADDNSTRTESLINQKLHPDVIFLPKEKKKGEKATEVMVDDVDFLVSESVIKPIELKKKIFVIERVDRAKERPQNKILKTLEEPPQNVHLILGACADFTLLQTLKSRVKTLTIPTFNEQEIFDVLKTECPDHDKLRSAISCGDGTIGKAYSLYGDKFLESAIDTAIDVLVNMKSSKDVLEFSSKVLELKNNLTEFLAVLELLGRDLLCHVEGKDDLIRNKQSITKTKEAQGFTRGAIIHLLECVVEANKRKIFNANVNMLVEWLLFQILEGKYKWRKL
jgi:DNA polymerase-3 subunit delta'